MGRQKPRRAALMTIGLALLLYRRAKTKPAEYTATALGSCGPDRHNDGALWHEKIPGVRLARGPPLGGEALWPGAGAHLDQFARDSQLSSIDQAPCTTGSRRTLWTNYGAWDTTHGLWQKGQESGMKQ